MSDSTAARATDIPSEKAVGKHAALYSASFVSFSLTFVGVSLAVLAGFIPAHLAQLGGRIDPEVVLLFVPLAALVFAIVAEVVRMSMQRPLRQARRRHVAPLSDPVPGHGEG